MPAVKKTAAKKAAPAKKTTTKKTAAVETGPRLLWVEAVLRQLSAENLTEGGKLNLEWLFAFAHLSQTYGEYLRAKFLGKMSVAERRHRDLVLTCRFVVTRELAAKHDKQKAVIDEGLAAAQAATKSDKAWHAASQPFWDKENKLDAVRERAEKKLLDARGIPALY